jgi:hypothetical protein
VSSDIARRVPPASPPAAPRSRLANEAVVAREPSSLYDYGGTDTTRLNGVDLTGRATSVPFTAVITGPSWTATDNITVAISCADSRLPKVAILLELALQAGSRLVAGQSLATKQ